MRAFRKPFETFLEILSKTRKKRRCRLRNLTIPEPAATL